MHNIVSGFKKIVKDGLDKPRSRWLLCLIASLYALIKTHKFAKVYFDDGVWVHKYRNEAIVDRKFNFISSLLRYESIAKDNYGFMYKLKPGDVVFDIGAGVGSDTYYFSKAVRPKGKVISIEAHPETFLCLKKFCRLNVLDNVTPINLAISDCESEVFITDDEKHISSSILNTAKNGIRVKSVSLDLLIERLEIRTIDFLKMNIEGAEKKAIEGMEKTIKRTKNICICCHDFKADRDGTEEMRSRDIVQEFLSDNGFLIIPRITDKRPWIRDQLNGKNKNFSPYE